MNHKSNLFKRRIHLVPVFIIGLTLPYKFSGNGLPYLIDFFDQLTGDGQQMMIFIGIQEAILIVLLMLTKTRTLGVYGTIATMLGAIATHVYLGEFDAVFLQALIVLVTCFYFLKINHQE